jgi:serine/threonine protein kinase
MANAPEQSLRAGSRVGGYEIVKVIGAGGFGITYEGYNPITRNRAAIKEFFPRGIVTRTGSTIVINDRRDAEIFDKVLKKFEETTTELAGLQHPHIVRVYDYLPGNRTGYMMMEYIEGEALRDVLDRHPSKVLPNEAEFRRIFGPILDAIRYVHSNNLIHRDISPENIMITKDGRPVLIDFGALRRQLDNTRVSTLMVAREKYAPPEQGLVEGLPHGFYTDIFALGATMYEALSGDAPIRAGNRIWARQDPYVPLARAAKIACRAELTGAIDRALKIRIEDRPQTMPEFIGLLGWGTAQARAPARQSDAPATQLLPGAASPATQLLPGGSPATTLAPVVAPQPQPQPNRAPVNRPQPAANFGAPANQPIPGLPAAPAATLAEPRGTSLLGLGLLVGAALLAVYFVVARSQGIFPFAARPTDVVVTPTTPTTTTPPQIPNAPNNIALAREQARNCLLNQPCNPSPCIPAVLGQWPNSPELGELRDFVRERCRVPNGVYTAEYTFPTSSATCPANAAINEVFVSENSISFTINNTAWRGAINQKSGTLDIKWDNIKPKPASETYIRGPFSNATLFDARCGEGQFKLHLRR